MWKSTSTALVPYFRGRSGSGGGREGIESTKTPKKLPAEIARENNKRAQKQYVEFNRELYKSTRDKSISIGHTWFAIAIDGNFASQELFNVLKKLASDDGYKFKEAIYKGYIYTVFHNFSNIESLFQSYSYLESITNQARFVLNQE